MSSRVVPVETRAACVSGWGSLGPCRQAPAAGSKTSTSVDALRLWSNPPAIHTRPPKTAVPADSKVSGALPSAVQAGAGGGLDRFAVVDTIVRTGGVARSAPAGPSHQTTPPATRTATVAAAAQRVQRRSPGTGSPAGTVPAPADGSLADGSPAGGPGEVGPGAAGVADDPG